MADDEACIVNSVLKILSRLLVINGPGYVEKFAEKTGGMTILQHRLAKWWKQPGVWTSCLAVLFGRDVAKIDYSIPFDWFNLMEVLAIEGNTRVIYPHILRVLSGMLQAGFKAVSRAQPMNVLPAKLPGASLSSGTDNTNHGSKEPTEGK